MLSTDSIPAYVFSCTTLPRATSHLPSVGVEMSPMRTQMGSENLATTEAVPGMQEPVLEPPKGATLEGTGSVKLGLSWAGQVMGFQDQGSESDFRTQFRDPEEGWNHRGAKN